MPKVTIFIDEAGTLPDPKGKVIIVAAVGTEIPNKLTEVTRQIRKKIRKRKRKEDITEIKFYRASERTKLVFLKELAKQSVDIFVLVVEKDGQKIPDTPENFALLCYILLEECILFYRDQIKEVIFDKHFHRDIDQEKFTQILSKLLKEDFSFRHEDSKEDIRVNAADMIAGSALWCYTGKKKIFYDLIKKKIISEKILNWKEAKRKFFLKIKNLT